MPYLECHNPNGVNVAEMVDTDQTSDAGKTSTGNSRKGVLGTLGQSTTASHDPLQRMIEIAKDPNLAPEDKSILIQFCRDRFKNRRIMAYIAPLSIVITLAFMLVASIFDGANSNPTKILKAISDNQGLIGTMEGFLTVIVAAYYGVSTWRPSS